MWPYWMAAAYAGMGEKRVALDWLDRAFGEHSGGLVWLNTDPRMDPLRQEPRFQDLLRRVGLPKT